MELPRRCRDIPGEPGALGRSRQLARFLNRKSQRHYRLKFADTYYGELNHYGIHWLRSRFVK